MNSFIHEGKALDWHFKVRNNVHYFYTGDIYQGQIHKIGKGWNVPCDNINIPEERRLSPSGFRTRYDAAHFILYLKYYFPRDLKERIKEKEKVSKRLKKLREQQT